MSPPPAAPKIYHIVHVDRLASIIRCGGLLSDSVMSQHTGHGTVIGMSDIKTRRLSLPVGCHPNSCVGDYVPFYFCPRSVMLYVIHMANHPTLAYRGGQTPIIHLEANLSDVAGWASQTGGRWAFSLSNAGARYTEFRNDLAELGEIDWVALASTDFRSAEVKEAKQAEFLLHGSFPWDLVSRIGVHSQSVGEQVVRSMAEAAHRPPVEIVRHWYY
jgi:hypothetical protein